MGGLADLFSGANFQSTIRRYCDAHGWKLADLEPQYAKLNFTMNSGREQILHITRFDTTVEFDVPSVARFDNEDSIPHFLSTLLLRRSAEKKIGFWCIEELRGRFVYSFMHNAEISLMTPEYFGRIVRTLIKECDDFEGLLAEMLR